MSDCTYRMTIKNGGDSRAAPIISKVIHFPAAELAIIIGKVTLGDTGLMAWATKFRKYQDIVRDDVELEINNAGQITRKITVKEASVLGYSETYDATDGLGRFELVLQKHYCGEQECFYIPVKQKDGNMKHIVYRLDTLCLESLNELTLHWSDQAKKTDFGKPISPTNPFFTDESRAAPLNISFSLISWDRETIYGQLELDLTAYIGRELLGHTRSAIQDRIGQLIADGYKAKYATATGEQSTRTVGGNTVKFRMNEWYRVSTGEKRMKVTAPRIKLAYNNVNPQETKGSGIPGILEFVGGAAVASAVQEEAAPKAEVAASSAPKGTVKTNTEKSQMSKKLINSNPFKGKSPGEIDKRLRDAGFEPKGPDPLNGKGGYVNPKTGRSYHIDKANSYGEPPHIDVNRPRDYKGPLDKKKYDM